MLKFEKAKTSLIDSLRRVEDIVQQSIGSQVVCFSLVVISLEFNKRSLAQLERILTICVRGLRFE